MMKNTPDNLIGLLCTLYSACLNLTIVPEAWRKAWVIPIPKQAGAKELRLLRPLKLLEVTRKAVLGILKERIKEEVEALCLLSSIQNGFRTGRNTATAAMQLALAYEHAAHLGRDLHVLGLDIRKAYNTVVKTIGIEAALRRFGIPMKAVEFLMEGERRSMNTVRSHWDGVLEEEGKSFPFEAELGFTQGAAESPLL